MNLQALAAMDDCEHATGRSLDEHAQAHRTPEQILEDGNIRWTGREINAALRDAGYMIVQVVQTGNKHWPGI